MRYLTAGESHGSELTTIIEGIPAGLPLNELVINQELRRRQKGYGRGGRMTIESDTVRITSGVRHGYTLGSPITLVIQNKDFKNWHEVMSTKTVSHDTTLKRRITKPRPGHADLVGGLKYKHTDLRNVLERSSARETAVRVAIGAICKTLLKELGVEIVGHVSVLGGIQTSDSDIIEGPISQIKRITEESELRITLEHKESEIKQYIDDIKKKGDTLGGVVEVLAEGMPAGIGSYVHWDRKLDGKIAGAMMSINAFKGVEFGIGFQAANLPGSQVMDEINWNTEKGYFRDTNHLGGLEGGMTTGERIVVKGVMKPIPTLYKPLRSVDIDTKERFRASIERSDVTAVPAAAVVAENVVATVLATEILDQFPSDSFSDLKKCVEDHRKYLLNK